MPKKISPELAAALKAGEADRRPHDAFAHLPSEEHEVLRAARQHARLTGVSLFDVSTQIINMTHGEIRARRVAEQAGIPWPTVPAYQFFGHPRCYHTSNARDFVRDRWGDLLEAVVTAGKNPGCTDYNLFDSPTVRVILGMAREGTRSGRPEFEDALRRVAAALAPPPALGKRPTSTFIEEERLLHAAFLFRAFEAITEWAAALGAKRPKGAALLAFLRTDIPGPRRPYAAALESRGILPQLPFHFEGELLAYVVQAVEMPGKRASARKTAFHAFAVAHGFAPQGSTPAAFLHALREHDKTVRNREDRASVRASEDRTSGLESPHLMRPHAKPPILSPPSAERAGRKRDTHDAEAHPQPPRPQQAQARRSAPRLPSSRPPAPRRDQPERTPEHDRRGSPPSHPARPRRPRPSG